MAGPMEGRNKLLHAMLWLRSEKDAPAWTTAGVYFALNELDKAKRTFYVNSVHRSIRCKRCVEIAAVTAQGAG